MFKTSTFRVATTLAAICLCGPAWALGSTPVTVVNPVDIAKAEGIEQPYQQAANCNFTQLPDVCQAVIQTPPTQRLVIEFVSGGCNNATTFRITLSTTSEGITVAHFLSAGALISQLVRIYADPASVMTFTATASQSNPNNPCSFTVSGQAVTVP